MNSPERPFASPRLATLAARTAEYGAWASVALLAAWTRWPTIALLILAAFSALAALRGLASRPGWRAAASVILLAAAIAGASGSSEANRILNDWPDYWAERRFDAEGALADEVAQLLESGEQLVVEMARLPLDATDTILTRQLQALRRRAGVTAVALYGGDGRLETWTGTHWGVVPDPVKFGEAAYWFADNPLFSYLYFTAPTPEGGVAIAAKLLKTGVPASVSSGIRTLSSDFQRRTGETLDVVRSERAIGEDVLDLTWPGDPLLSVLILQPAQEDELRAARALWVRVVGLLAIAAWLILAIVGAGSQANRRASGITLGIIAVLVPLDSLLGVPGVFSRADFLLPGLERVSLDRVIPISLAAALLVGAFVRRARRRGSAIGILAILGGFPLLVWAFDAGVSAPFAAGPEPRWFAHQLTLAVVLSIVANVGITLAAPRSRVGPRWPGSLSVTVVLVLALVGLAGTRILRVGHLHPLFATLWVLPAFTAALGVSRLAGHNRRWTMWALSALLGSSLAVLGAWSARLEASRVITEQQLERLGPEPDPYLEFVLFRLVDRAAELDAEDAPSVEILYDSWRASGMAEEGSSVSLTIRSAGGIPEADLKVGPGELGVAALEEFALPGDRPEGPEVLRVGLGEVNYAVRVPLSGGRLLAGIVPPRRTLPTQGSLEPLIGAPGGGGIHQEGSLTLVPLLPGDSIHAGDIHADEGVTWALATSGWKARSLIRYPDGNYDALYEIAFPAPVVLVARATLIVVLDASFVLLLLLVGQVLLKGRRVGPRTWRLLPRSFRARVTLALFGFFILSSALIGVVTLRTISAASVRTSAALAERVVAGAAGFYRDEAGQMELLAARVGADLLEYRDGELRGGSVDDLVELGLYEGWMPHGVFVRLEAREELVVVEPVSLGQWQYLMAFQRLPDGDVVATPVSLQAGALALGGREVAEIAGFVAVLGVLFSLALALLVGRTLTRPIRILQMASERVGSGNLRVQLPGDRSDEFGSVFTAFNRMVLRLRRARRALVRTTRRTEAIVEEAATGVIALDPLGVVTVVNPRAQSLLAGGVEVGERLPPADGPTADLVRWIREYVRDGQPEATGEFTLGERRLRVRARRISRQGPGGVVLSLEDVTDELRTERILAWGEMARQVAHEVKNPLTPIKLSVQHVQQAWGDDRDDFAEILNRNAQAILNEIERLDSIARGFSRFGAPEASGTVPLEAVELERVCSDILALYRGADASSISFDLRLPESIPPVQARETELREVLFNLMENARAAIDGEGTVTLEGVSVPGAVELRVRDDGVGIPDEILERIFEPHFSTRSAGTGLGLAIVRRLVESWGGTVTAESGRGEGTLVRIHLEPWEAAAQTEAFGDGEAVP